jgi:hypothetical protein
VSLLAVVAAAAVVVVAAAEQGEAWGMMGSRALVEKNCCKPVGMGCTVYSKRPRIRCIFPPELHLPHIQNSPNGLPRV